MRRLPLGTLLLDLPDLPDGFLEDGTFVGLDVEAVDVGEVGRDELRQLLDVFALLLPPTLVTPAGDARGIRHVAMTTTLPPASWSRRVNVQLWRFHTLWMFIFYFALVRKFVLIFI